MFDPDLILTKEVLKDLISESRNKRIKIKEEAKTKVRIEISKQIKRALKELREELQVTLKDDLELHYFKEFMKEIELTYKPIESIGSTTFVKEIESIHKPIGSIDGTTFVILLN